MKKTVILTFMLIACFCSAFGQSEISLDTAIQQASKAISDSLFVGVKVAMLNCGSGSAGLSSYIVDKMTNTMDSTRKLTLIVGRDVDRARGEINLLQSSEINDSTGMELDKKLGAAIVVTGSFTKNGNSYRYTVRALDVNTKALQKSASFNVKDDQQVRQLLGINDTVTSSERTPDPVPAATVSPPQTPSQTSAAPVSSTQTPNRTSAASATYKIGDTGPAGGFIFYDKGNNNEGWRYLEAAPMDVEFRDIRWSVHNTILDNTQKNIGFGKRNTQLIVDEFKQTPGEWDTAAQKTDDLVFNGFDDWFLPSQDELDQMYGSLKRKKIGNFKDGRYWSSTQSTQYKYCAYYQDFGNGEMSYATKSNSFFVRPIRQVAGQ